MSLAKVEVDARARDTYLLLLSHSIDTQTPQTVDLTNTPLLTASSSSTLLLLLVVPSLLDAAYAVPFT